jgi:hypothetical protein
LTRRANHRHIFIVARSLKARVGKPARGFFHSNYPNRAAAAGTILPTRAQVAKRHSAPPSELHLAGPRARAGHLASAQNMLKLSAIAQIGVHEKSARNRRMDAGVIADETVGGC